MGNILITGGGLYHNTGAQAMTCVAIDEVKRRFPSAVIYEQNNTDIKRPEADRAQYAFEIIGVWPRREMLFLAGGLPTLYVRLRGGPNKRLIEQAKRVLQDLDMLVDVSGFTFGSSWGIQKALMLALRVRVAKRHGAKVYVMPQSFGPFDFKGLKGRLFQAFAAHCLRGADAIFAREQAGYEGLTQRYRLTNVHLSDDLVLQNKGVDPALIYKNPPAPREPDISGPAPVAIVPNIKTFQHGNKRLVLDLYKLAVDRLLALGRTVYLLYHSPDDAPICRMIRQMYEGEPRVIYLDEQFTSFDFERFMHRFEFLIASRFHSIVHAYKHGVPCVVLGWAVKYGELLESFGQGDAVFDVRRQVDGQALIDAIDRMHERHSQASEAILKRLEQVQQHNVFDALGAEARRDS